MVAAVLIASACTDTKAPAPKQASLPPQSSVATSVPTTGSAIPVTPGREQRTPQQVAGKVVETMSSGGYTYVLVRTSDGDEWAAVRETEIKKGSPIVIEAQMVAENFESATLKRTFGRLVMGSIANAEAPAPPPQSLPATVPGFPMERAVEHMTSASGAGEIAVEKAPGGKSVAETWSERQELAGKEVIIRGKVVKFLPQIMGRNWMHLRDGSGSRSDANDDITITTTEVARVGDVVTVSGTLRVDKDFGSGYRYPVIIEDAKLRKDAP